MAINEILKFIKLTHEFQKVERKIFVTGQNRMENDFEHSYQLAMLAWYIVDSKKLNHLNKDLIIKYALLHDFVEVYAGDTYIYSKDEKELNSKETREKEAQKRLQEEFSEFSDMNDLIEQYEARNDKESRFVYALDKVIPVLNIYLDKGRTWKEFDVSIDMIVKAKTDKVDVSEEVRSYFEELVQILKSDESLLFKKT